MKKLPKKLLFGALGIGVLAVVSVGFLVWSLQPPNPTQSDTGSNNNLSALPSCVLLQNWQKEGAETWWKAVKDGDTYTLCGEPFHTGPADESPYLELDNGQKIPLSPCFLPSIDDAVMVKNQTEDYPYHRIIGEHCLDDMYGGIQGRCKIWNCSNITVKAPYTSGCFAIPQRMDGSCQSMWGINERQ